jgi:hypothetical protein
MKIFFLTALTFFSLELFGQDSTGINEKKFKQVLNEIKKKNKNDAELIYTPIIDKTGLVEIQVSHNSEVIFGYTIDPKTYKLVGVYDLR